MHQLNFHQTYDLRRSSILKKAFANNSIDVELKTVRLGAKKCHKYDPGMMVLVTLGDDKNTSAQTGILGNGRIIRCEKLNWISFSTRSTDFVDNLDGRFKGELEKNLKNYYKLASIRTDQAVSVITFCRIV